MSEQAENVSYEERVRKILQQKGVNPKLNFSFKKWKPDIVGEVQGKAVILVDAKTSQVGIPDVLSLASTAFSSDQPSGTIMPVVISKKPITQGVSQVADENNVVIVTGDVESGLEPKLAFLIEVSLIDGTIRKMGQFSPKLPLNQAVRELVSRNSLKPDLANRILVLWQKRNRLAHLGDGEGFDTQLVEEAKTILDELPK